MHANKFITRAESLAQWQEHATLSIWRSASLATATAAFLISLSPLHCAELPWTQQDAYHEAASEAAECEAYYASAKQCAANSGQTDLLDSLEQARDAASKLQYTFGKASGMSDKAILAMLALALTDAVNSMEHSCRNLSIIVLKDGKSCQFFLEHPDARLKMLSLGPPAPR